MTKNTKEWLIVFGVPLAIIILLDLLTIGKGISLLFLLLIGGTIGIPVGFVNTPIDSIGNFKIFCAVALIFALVLIGVGFYSRKRLWGKIMVVVGLLLWSFGGLIVSTVRLLQLFYV